MEKPFSNICGDCSAERRIKPNDVALPISFFIVVTGFVKLDKALLFAKQHHDILNDNTRLIKHCRKSLLFSNNEAWKKKQTESCFDVAMQSFDGAEVCELVGIYILCFLAKLVNKEDWLR